MWGHPTTESQNENNKNDYGEPVELSMVPTSYPIGWHEQPASRHDQINYHYPPAQAEHGRWFNNVSYGNAIPNSMQATSKAIPGVTQLPWMIQFNKEIIPFQLRNTAYPYGGQGMSVAQSTSLLQKASALFAGIMNQTGGGNKNG